MTPRYNQYGINDPCLINTYTNSVLYDFDAKFGYFKAFFCTNYSSMNIVSKICMKNGKKLGIFS